MAQLNTQQQATNVKKHIYTENRPMSGTETDTRPSDDDKSPSPVVDPDAKVLSEVQEEFVKPYINWSPVKLKLKQIVTTITEHTCCWRTDDDSKIILGGEGCLTVLRDNGVEKVYKLWNIDLRVISGLSITSEKQLICVEDLYSNAKEVHTVNIPQGIPDDTELHCVNTLDIMDPVCMFLFDKLHYGVLCENSSIECYSLKNILLDHEPAVTDVIKLDIDISGMDTACATPDGNVVVTSYENRSIYVYNVDGGLLNTFSPSNTWTLENDWHQLYWDGEQHRLFVQCSADGVIVASDNRVICMVTAENCFREESGDAIKSLMNISYCVSSEGRTWFINGDARNEVHIYICDNTSTPQANSCRAKQYQQIVIIEPNTGMCPTFIEYSKTIKAKRDYLSCWRSDNNRTIFLGGLDIITLLGEDETETTYNLWDNELSVISGLSVTSEKMLICVKNAQGNTEAHIIDVLRDLPRGTQLRPLTAFIVNNPICIFLVDKLWYGILCKPKSISLFTLRDILRGEELTAGREISIACEVSDHDSACVTPDNNFCVTSWRKPGINMYDVNGVILYEYDLDITIRSNMGKLFDIFSDGQCHRLFVQYCENGIVLASDNGVVCALQDGCCNGIYSRNTRLEENMGSIRHCVIDQGMMWCITERNEIQIYTFDTSSPAIHYTDNTRLHVSSSDMTTFEHDLTNLVYDKSVPLTTRHNCCWRGNSGDEIFLGGNNTISVLRDENEGVRVLELKLWDKNLTVTSGHAVTNVIHLLCYAQKQGNSYISTVNIPKNVTNGTEIHHIHQLYITNPISVFYHNSIFYGALCKTKRLEFFGMRGILLDTPKCWGHHKTLEHDISDMDTACSSRLHDICIASYFDRCVYVHHSNAGTPVRVISIPGKDWNRASHRLFVQCFNDSIVVASERDFIRSYEVRNPHSCLSKRKKYDNISRKLERMTNCIFTATRLWIIDRDDSHTVHISKY